MNNKLIVRLNNKVWIFLVVIKKSVIMKFITVLLLLAAFSTEPPADFKTLIGKKNLKKFQKDYSYIPSGTIKYDDKKISVAGFFMHQTEVSNLDYREFLQDVKKIGDNTLLEKVDFIQNDSDQKSIYKTYHNHPAFNDYPVFNISHFAAKEYCKWLETKLSKEYEINVNDIQVRLPSRAEWTYAAKGGRDLAPYPWEGYYTRNANGKVLANFNSDIGTHNITLNQETGEYEIVNDPAEDVNKMAAPVKTYYPNEYGLFNMSGNASEMVNEEGIAMGGSWMSTGYDIRVTSEYKYTKANAQVGFRPIVSFRS